jgi:hypothetical protein
MESNIIERLFASFTDLEQAITRARSTLNERPAIPAGVMKRLDSYDSILTKQRTLAIELCEAIAKKDWDEVSRVVSIINGLSAMIRDDAKAILAAISDHSESPTETETENFC